ncbi:IS66 family insertion sequence element accessory protein TnpB [Enterococcus sp. AZ194]|uniref:IS66 family insertion sequence element accessory protein TnpB n=1 Tax=Enterococcus sp. AZ194 TaxID=2774629 RepID=UPI003F685C77
MSIVTGKTDLRRGIDGLANLIQQEYELDVYSDALFLFAVTDVIASRFCIVLGWCWISPVLQML